MLIRNLIWLAIVAAVTLAGARVVADRLVLNQAAALTAATRRLAAGDLQVRAGRPDDHTELGGLARSFDEMAEALERRTAERMRAAEELVRSEKMAALGRLAAGVAHELRNPLTVIAGRIEVLKRQMVQGELPTLNLATNAVQAMAETAGGQLTMTAHPADGLGAVVVKITDTLPGIPADALEKIWEPFYTTKAEGTGIGLSIVRSLVDQQPGAAITVESHPGSGTTFQVTLPTTREDAH